MLGIFSTAAAVSGPSRPSICIFSVSSGFRPCIRCTAAFNRHRPCDGRVRIYLRLSGALNAEFDTLKARLGEVTGDQCGVRETVIFCALAISLRQISLAKAAF